MEETMVTTAILPGKASVLSVLLLPDLSVIKKTPVLKYNYITLIYFFQLEFGVNMYYTLRITIVKNHYKIKNSGSRCLDSILV